MRIGDKLKHAWNAFMDIRPYHRDNGPSSSHSNYRSINMLSSRTIASTIFNRIAIDASMTTFKHVKVNPENEDEVEIKSGLNNILNVEANIDQSHIQFVHDIVYSMFDEGVVAVVPVDTNLDPETGSFDILSMRVGKIVNWFPKNVEIMLYNEQTGQNERIIMSKRNVAIIENPLYSVVNGENSTLKRLMKKLSQLDNIDDIADSGRLDLLVSVPYSIKTKAQQKMAEDRIREIERQLSFGRNGIAYIDGTEKVTQLNRPANSQLKENIKELTQQLYNQLGLTENIFNGTASETELRTYYARTIDPIISNVVSEFIRKFITKTARTQGHTIRYYRDLFKHVPVETIAGLGDAFRRNSIASSNELRRIIGLKNSSDPRADELFNPNMADNKQAIGSVDIPSLKPENENLIKEERLRKEKEELESKGKIE